MPDLGDADLDGAILSGLDLRDVYLNSASLAKADLRGSDLRLANLFRAFLPIANLMEADLSGAQLRLAMLPRANLSGAVLIDSILAMANLSGADLRWAMVTATDFTKADLSGANLSGARLIESNFRETNLSGANLSKTFLREANFIGTNLRGADLSEALIEATVFGNADLSEAKGLHTCKHVGPSTIGIDTIYRSKGKIPVRFLRGAGVSEALIESMKKLPDLEHEYFSCFISYSSADQDFAERLHADLQDKGVRCWFAPHDVQGGRKLHEQIDEAIRVHDKLLLILSRASINSEWVKTEIAKARKREVHEKRRMLFPVTLVNFETLRDWEAFDADTGKDMAREIREYFIPDFSQWKDHDFPRHAFERLLRDLQTAAAATR
jgi:uncharacterized protein YjbI with pentapeptide repeats